jgi:BlaR1 peptidase M56
MFDPILKYNLASTLILLIGVVVFHVLFLKSTYLKWNRSFLLGLLLASLIIPHIHLPESWTIWRKINVPSKHIKLVTPSQPVDEAMIDFSPSSGVTQLEQKNQSKSYSIKTQPKPTHPIRFMEIVTWLYGLGCLALGIRFILQILSLWKLYRKARIEQRGSYRLAVCPGALSPFAFGRTVFVSDQLYRSPELDLVLTHELAHISQGHTWDILLAELTLIWQWFNPAAWYYRRLVENNLEYLADQAVLQQQWDKKAYQLSLLSWANPAFNNSLSTSYSFSLLKERIVMMNSKPSPKQHTLRYALVFLLLPLLPVLNRPVAIKNTLLNHTRKPAALDAPVTYETVPVSLDQKAFFPQEKKESFTNKLPQATPTNSELKQNPSPDTIIPQPEINTVLIIVDLDIDHAELERLAKTPLKINKRISYTLDEKGRLGSIALEDANGSSCRIYAGENSEFPLVIQSHEGGCGTEGFDFNILKKMQTGNWSKNMQVIMGGIPSAPQEFEAYKAKILSNQNNTYLRRLLTLESKKWREVVEDAHSSFEGPISDEGIDNIRNRIERCIKAEKELIVSINDGPVQSTMPDLASLKIKHLNVHMKSRNFYVTGTTSIYRTDWVGLRVEIFTVE